MKRLTQEEFINRIFNKVGNEYTVLGNYKNNKTKIKMKHNICNNTWEVAPNDFLKGTRCPYCANNQLKTIERFKKEVYELVKDEYIVLSDKYINNKTPLLMKHSLCGFEFNIQPNDFLSHNHRCPYCKGGSYKNNKKIFYKKMENYKEFKIIGNYINDNTEIKLNHINCNTIFKIKPNLFFKKKCKCPTCDNNKKTHKEFINEISKLVDLNEYIPLSIYESYNMDFKFKHTKCNNIYTVKPYRFLNGDRCPYCKRSKGEERIIKWLKDNNIEYEQYVTFKDLFYKSKNHPLTFDIRILCENPNDYILIEYDGEFHERNVFSKENLKNQQIRDSIKDEYCKNHDNIDFYRINYKDFNNIESIMENIISKY